jgi:hypothetical protein
MSTMTVGALIAALKELPEDLEVITPKDDEGNGYRWVNEGWVSATYLNTEDDEWLSHYESFEEYVLDNFGQAVEKLNEEDLEEAQEDFAANYQKVVIIN